MTTTEKKAVGTATGAHSANAEPPINVDAVQEAISKANTIWLDVPPRRQVDQHTQELTEHAQRLLREDYPAGEQNNPVVIAAFRALYKLLDLAHRPTPTTTNYTAWMYTRNLANATHTLLDLHRRYQVP
ncbi:hypothetical protein OG883_31265 [Streptomyces sp. NBC_01142]|nr:hypothetical protein [Streptomyces sp. NBC_01142]